MTATSPAGLDEIVLAAPRGRHLCHLLEHHNAGRLADVIVTFGQLGTRWPDALWPDCWRRSYPMCQQCWHATQEAAETRRPNLVIRDVTQPGPSHG